MSDATEFEDLYLNPAVQIWVGPASDVAGLSRVDRRVDLLDPSHHGRLARVLAALEGWPVGADQRQAVADVLRAVGGPTYTAPAAVGDDAMFEIVSPVRHGRRQTHRLRLPDERQAGLLRTILGLYVGAGADLDSSAIPQEHLAALLRLGLLLGEEQLPRRVRFRCALDGKLDQLVPRKRRDEVAAAGSNRCVVAPGVLLQRRGAAPPAGLCTASDAFARDRPILWVTDPGTQIAAPHWLKSSSRAALADLLAGRVAPDALPAEMRERLMRASVLVPAGAPARRATAWAAQCDQARVHLAAHQYAVFRGILPPLQLAALRRYFRELHRQGYFDRDGIQVLDRDVIHNEPVARFFHPALAALLNRVTPERIKPSYCFLSMYKPGAVLERHVDRPQCAWNMSVVFDTDPETDETDGWPIYLETAAGERALRLAMGDGVVYRGTDLPHWRDAQPAGHRSIICFYHFVDESFDGTVD